MTGIVYIDGNFFPAQEAKISVLDHGFLYGDGLFETMRTYNGDIFRVEDHLDRLFNAANLMDIKIPINSDCLKDALYQTLKKNKLQQEAYIRLSVTRGVGPIGIDPDLCEKATIVILVKELFSNPRIYTEGIEAIIVKTRRNSINATDPRLKTLNFINNIFAKREVKAAGVQEGIMLNQLGEVAEATVSNIFLVKDDILLTPGIKTGILPGITRRTVIEQAAGIFVTKEKTIYPEDLYRADEIFLTNSTTEIIPVTILDGRTIGKGMPGPITRQVHNSYRNSTCL